MLEVEPTGQRRYAPVELPSAGGIVFRRAIPCYNHSTICSAVLPLFGVNKAQYTRGVGPPMVPSIFLYSSPSAVMSDFSTQQPTRRRITVSRRTNVEWRQEDIMATVRLILKLNDMV